MTSLPVDSTRQLYGSTSQQDSLNPSSEQGLTPEDFQFLLNQRKYNAWKSWIDECFIKARNQRAPFERQWYINLAFISGQQYISPVNIPGFGFRLTSPKAPPHRVRLVINITRRAVRKELAKLTSNKPIPTVVPATNEDEDQTAAIVSEKVLKAQFANSVFGQTYLWWVWWGVCTGASFIKSAYDPNEPDYECMTLPERPVIEGQEITDEYMQYLPPQLKQYLQTPQPAQGKVCYSHVSPFQIYVGDLMIANINDQPWVLHCMTKSPEWVERKFGFKPQCDAKAATTIMDAATVITKGNQQSFMDSVLVREMWIKPGGHKDFPKGGMLTQINEKLVQIKEEWPLPFPEYPFYQYRGVPTGGFYDDSTVTDLVPLQKEYNKTRSQMVEIKNVMGKPKIMYEKGSVNPRMISSEVGQSIPYTPGFNPPTELRGTEYPQSFINEVATLKDEFDDIAGQHDISNGETPPGVTSGTAITFLSEQDEQGLSFQVAGIEFACELLGSHHLKYVTRYWNDNRIIRVTGRDNTFESIIWKKHAMEGNTDVRVQTGSALPTSKAARQALITEWMMNGFMAPEVGLEILDMGNYEKAMEEFLVDKRQAQRENLKIAEGSDKMFEVLMQPPPEMNPMQDDSGRILVSNPKAGIVTEPPPQALPQGPDDTETPTPTLQQPSVEPEFIPWQPQPPIPVNSWDNHEAHIKWHNLFRKTQEFDQLSETKKKVLELHVQGHQTAVAFTQVNLMGTPVSEGTMGGGPLPPGGMGAGMEQPPQDPNAEGPPSNQSLNNQQGGSY